MRKNFGAQTWICPMPVLILGTYDEKGVPDAMNAAWGGTWDYNKIFVSLSEHKTTKNLNEKKAFTIAFADSKHVVEADYVGIVSANQVPDKVKKAGLKVEKSTFVDAPIFVDFPLSLECEVESFEDGNLIGKIINVSADSSVLGSDGKVDVEKLDLITYDPIHFNYIKLGDIAGKAFSDGKRLK